MFFRYSIKITISLLCLCCFTLSSCSDNNSSPSTRKLNDTGITWGGDYPKDINEDCSAQFNTEQLAEGESYEGDLLSYQDCSQGADASGKKRPAFEYVKVSAEGKLLKDDSKEWSCVLDKISGLLWEVKAGVDEKYGNTGWHDGDDLFTWYNARPIMNGGAVGDWNARYDQCAGYQQGQPSSYCNIEELVSRVNTDGYCGFNDWRVPLRTELESLVNFGRTMPAIDVNYFPNTKNNYYWSYTPVAGQKTMAWAVSFQFGLTSQLKRDNGRNVRLVRTWSQQDAN